MSSQYVQVAADSTGKKIQVFENTVGGNVVEAQGVVHVDSSGAEITTWPVSAASLPLPSGASTAANQTSANTKLDTLHTDLAKGQQAAASSLSVVLSTDGPFTANFGVQADTAASSDTGSFSLIAFVKRSLQNWTTLLAKTWAVTQSGTWTVQPGNTANTTAWKVDGSAVTQPVSGTFWQATQPISGSVTVSSAPSTAVTNAGTFAVQLANQPGPVNSANSQVTASTSAATLAVARVTRRRLLVKNTDAAITVYVGAATVTSANGMPLLAGESAEFRAQILYQVISASGSPVVAIVDEYD